MVVCPAQHDTSRREAIAARHATAADTVALTLAATRQLVETRARLLDRQRRLRLARCGSEFRVLGMVEDQNRVAVTHEGDRVVLALIGDFDIGDATDLRALFDSVAERHLSVTVDLTDTTFMDSSAVHALVYARRAGLTVVIRGRGPARRVIDLTGLDAVFELED